MGKRSLLCWTPLLFLFSQCGAVDPDVHRSICQIVLDKRPQYLCDVANVTTSDGFILQTFHIRASEPTSQTPTPVLLWHGLMDCAFSWVMNMADQSLPYLLVDRGYDVWLGNSRGTVYGLEHAGGLTPDDVEFWRFSWDQMGALDVPATVRHIRSTTGAAKVGYVGHSQGTIQMFAALSEGSLDPSHIAFFGALGPVIIAPHQKDPIWKVFSSKALVWIGQAVDKKAFTIPSFLKPAVDLLCLITPRMCNDVLELFVGVSHGVNTSRIDVMTAHEPGGTSTLNMAHWAQLVNPGHFQKFDFGAKLNRKYYNGSSTAPKYNISNYPPSVPTCILSGAADVLADPVDVSFLVASLPDAPTIEHHELPQLGHMDFLWDVDAVNSVYKPYLLPFIMKYMPLQ